MTDRPAFSKLENDRASLASLGVKVEGLDRDSQDIRRAVAHLDTKIDSSISSLASRFEQAINGIHTKLDSRSTTPWQTIWGGLAVVFTMLASIGTAIYLPIQRDTSRLDAAMSAVLERGVFQKTYDSDQLRIAGLLSGLRGDLSIVSENAVRVQRYNTDQERLTHTLDDIRNRFADKTSIEATFRERQRQIDGNTANLEALRLRTYDNHGRMSHLEQAQKDTAKIVEILAERINQLRAKRGE